MSKEKSKVTKNEETKPRPRPPFNPDVKKEPNGKFYSDSELQQIFNSLINAPWKVANNTIVLLQNTGKPIHQFQEDLNKDGENWYNKYEH